MYERTMVIERRVVAVVRGYSDGQAKVEKLERSKSLSHGGFRWSSRVADFVLLRTRHIPRTYGTRTEEEGSVDKRCIRVYIRVCVPKISHVRPALGETVLAAKVLPPLIWQGTFRQGTW